MPVERVSLSRSQFGELMGYPPARIKGVEYHSLSSTVTLVLEPEDDMQTSGTCPPLSDNTSKRKPKGGKR